MKTLSLGRSEKGKAFTLPLEFTTQTAAILAKKGSGKSYTASVIAEELLANNQQVVVLDPTGAWWGLRSSADGKSDGHGIVVIGGDHADVPLEPTAGEVLAQAIVEKRFSAIIDMSLLRKGETRRFVTPFLETLYRLNRDAMHLVVDEADDIAPQKPFGDEAAMVGAMEDVVKRGRRKGIGCTLITQRPADLAKQVLTQCEMVIALRIAHPRDIKAVMEWVNVHADPAAARDMMDSLPALPIGTAWFWSPGWGDIFERVQVRQRKTFDSGATPKPGQTIKPPARLAAVDVQALGQELASVVERAMADNPKQLKLRIAELEKQLKESNACPDTSDLVAGFERIRRALDDAVLGGQAISNWLRKAGTAAPAAPRITQAKTANVPRIERPAPRASPAAIGPVKLSKSQGAIMGVLAAHGPLVEKARLALIAGYSASGGGFNNALGALRTAGLIDGSDPISLTDAGLQLMVDVPALPTGQALLQHWLGHSSMTKATKAILQALADHGGSLSKTDLAAHAGYEESGGGFNNALGSLRTLGLISGSKEITLAQDLA